MTIQPNYDSPDQYDEEQGVHPFNTPDTKDDERYGFESEIVEGGDVHSWGPTDHLNPDPDIHGFSVLPSDERTQNPTTLVPGAPVSPHQTLDVLFDDENTVELGASEAVGFRSMFMDNTKAYLILPYSVYRKRALISWNGSAADIVIGRLATIDSLIGTTAIANAQAKGAFWLPRIAGAGNCLQIEYTSKQALYGLMVQAAFAYALNVFDESYQGSPQIG